MIDSHCHLNDKEFIGRIAEVISTAKEVGVTRLICNGWDMSSTQSAIEIAEKNSGVFATVGLGYEPPSEPLDQIKDQLISLAASPLVVAVGECGLDFTDSTSDEDRQKQLELFNFHILLAQELELPLVVHCRNAHQQVYQTFKNTSFTRAQMHCWTGDWEWAKKFIDLDCFVSFGGITTFKSSESLRDVVKKTPTEKILIETDSPYLAPEPVRSQPNSPANLIHTAKLIAQLRSLTLTEVDQLTSANSLTLFPKLKLPIRE
ncbi:MAG: TatD family hydrolase [bacterium]|nr:TatD family hydrolase [bacterium]